MTSKERILAAFHGEQPDMVPFSPNIYYWFYNRLAREDLPAEIAGARHPFDALRFLGADILARWDTQYATREVYTEGEFSDEFTGESRFSHPMVTAFNIYPPHNSVRRRKLVTPHGTLTHTWTLTEESGADFESEFWWKDWDQYEAVRFLLETREYVFDEAEFQSWVDRLGDDGPRLPRSIPGKVSLVDCTNVVSGITEHSYYNDTEKVIDDMARVLQGVPSADIEGRSYDPETNRYRLLL